MVYQVTFAGSAAQEFRALPWDTKNRLESSVDALRVNPRPTGVRKIKGKENLFRLRVGSYRLVYKIDEEKKIIRIIRVRHRRDAYR